MTSGHRIVAALICLGVLDGADGAAQIATATNIDLCLTGSLNESLKLVDCLEGGADDHWWDAWGWEPRQKGLVDGSLCMNGACVGGDLQFTQGGSESWTWSDRSMRLQYGGKCLTVVDEPPRVELAECDWNPGNQQNRGGPASQVWVLLPKSKPQLDVLPGLKFPMRSSGRYIVDSEGKTVKLVGVNWYGAHLESVVNNGLDRTTIKKIAARIKRMGYNSVRLNYAITMTDDSSGSFPLPPDPKLVAGDPDLAGLTALEVFDKCVEELTALGLLVIINNHMSDAAWCCNLDDDNALWYNDRYPEEAWMKSLEFLAARYKDNQRVIGFDIRNEPRGIEEETRNFAYWGVWEPGASLTSGKLRLADWRVGAAKGAVATWKGNPDALVIVEGFQFAQHLKWVLSRPMKLKQECLFSRVVYENHDYPFYDFGYQVWDWLEMPWRFATIAQDLEARASAEENGENEGISGDMTEEMEGEISREYQRFVDARESSFLFMHTEDRAPVWTGEFGTNDRNSTWWQNVIRIYKDVDYSWCYWPLDAVTVLPGISNRVIDGFNISNGRNDSYGLFDWRLGDYRAVVGWKLQDMISIMGTRPDFPASLAAPDTCEFVAEENEAYAAERTTLWEVLSTTNWPLMILIFVLVMAACGAAGCVLQAWGYTCKLLYDKIVELCGSCKGGSPQPEAEPLNA